MCVLFISSQARIFLIFCWMAGKHSWLSSTSTLNRRLSTFVNYWHNCNWLQWNEKKKSLVVQFLHPHHHTHTRSLTHVMPSANIKENRNHPLFSLPLEKLCRLSWSPWKQHDLEGLWELLFKLNCSEKSKEEKKQNNLSGFLFSILFGIRGCLSVSSVTSLMQTECCLRLVHVFFFFWGKYNRKPLRWLLYSTATCSVFPMALLCSFLFYA